MDEKPDKIVQHIESTRTELGRNLDELQTKVRETADWRAQFDKHPYILMGAAMGGGILLSSMIGGGPSSRSRYSYGSRASASMPQTSSSYVNQPASPPSWQREGSYSGSMHPESSGTSYQRQKAWSTFENIKGALFGLAAAKAQEYLNEMLPGFREQFRDTEMHNRGGMAMGQEHGQGWNQPPQHQSWGQGVQNQTWNQGMQHNDPWREGHLQHQNWGQQQGRGFTQERSSGQPETWRHGGEHQGQWPQERNWERDRERDREREHGGAFENQPGFRR